jgi:hypothetical protein
MRYCFHTTNMTISRKKGTEQVRRVWRTQPLYIADDDVRCHSRYRYRQDLPWKLTDLSYDPVVTLLDYTQNNQKQQLGYLHVNVHNSIVHSSQNMEHTYRSINRWIDEQSVYSMKYYSVIKRSGVWIHARTWMNLETIMLCEMSQKLHAILLMRNI